MPAPCHDVTDALQVKKYKTGVHDAELDDAVTLMEGQTTHEDQDFCPYYPTLTCLSRLPSLKP